MHDAADRARWRGRVVVERGRGRRGGEFVVELRGVEQLVVDVERIELVDLEHEFVVERVVELLQFLGVVVVVVHVEFVVVEFLVHLVEQFEFVEQPIVQLVELVGRLVVLVVAFVEFLELVGRVDERPRSTRSEYAADAVAME